MTISLSDHEAGARYDGDYKADLQALQQRLEQIQIAAIVREARVIIAFEGWDAAGKGGAIQRLTAHWDPRAFEVWPIAAPSEAERTRHFLWRFWKRLPARSEIAVFDRSWYGRVLVERVEGFASEAEWRRAYDEINDFEARQIDDGTIVIKLFLHITQATQDTRFRRRLAHPWKRWKLGPDDFRNRARRPAYLEAMHDMLARTDTARCPWFVIDGNRKKAARIAALSHIADRLELAIPMHPPEADPAIDRLAEEALGGAK